jgi:hypothetical protein
MKLNRRKILAGMLMAASSEAEAQSASPHIALLGDSVLDNGAYVGGAPDVVRQLQSISPPGWRSTLLAVDGAVIGGIQNQLSRLPEDITHIVVSIGGNDALGQSSVLEARLGSMSEALATLARIQQGFRADYSRMLDRLNERKVKLAACTIYDPYFPERERRALAATALSVLNHIITREVFRRSLTLIDLRVLLNEDADFANPIEPSARGGMKIAGAIKRVVEGEVSARVVS